MAKGGEIKHFCSSDNAHSDGCEYQPKSFAHKAKESAVNDVLLNGDNEASKWIMGSEDKEASVAAALLHCGAHHLLNGHMHGAYADPESGFHKIADDKLNKRLAKHMAKGGLVDSADEFAKNVMGSRHELAAPMLMKMVSNGETQGFNNLMSHANNISRGHKAMASGIEGVFGGKHKPVTHDTGERDKLHKFVETGGFNHPVPAQSALAGSGPMERMLPEHNMMLQEAKVRVSNYLNTLRPIKEPSALPFDKTFENPVQKRTYEDALKIANKPGHIFDLIRNGRLAPDQVKHLNSMYPEIANEMRKKMTEKIAHQQLEGTRPAYTLRQSLSLFLGAPLDSTLTPASIQSAQSVFAAQGVQKQSQAAPAKSMAKLGNAAKAFLTPDQSAVSRQQRAR